MATEPLHLSRPREDIQAPNTRRPPAAPWNDGEAYRSSEPIPATPALDRSPLYIRLLGRFGVTRNGARIVGQQTPRVQSLLAFLLLNRGLPQPRLRLVDIFWPNADAVQGLTNLRNLLHKLRVQLPDVRRFIHFGSHAVTCNADPLVRVDVEEFQLLVRSGMREALHQAIEMYKGELLPGCEDDWIVRERARLHQAFLEAADRLSQVYEQACDYPNAIHYARLAIYHEPSHETAYQRLIRCHAARGERAAAVATFHACVHALRRELGIEPSPSTTEALRRLLAAPPAVARRLGAAAK